MKKYRKMFVSSYADERFYIEKFEMGADAYREDDYEGIIERLRVVSIISSHKLSKESEKTIEGCGSLFMIDLFDDYDVIFEHDNIIYHIIFESDGEIDELPEINDIIYC